MMGFASITILAMRISRGTNVFAREDGKGPTVSSTIQSAILTHAKMVVDATRDARRMSMAGKIVELTYTVVTATMVMQAITAKQLSIDVTKWLQPIVTKWRHAFRTSTIPQRTPVYALLAMIQTTRAERAQT
jgi:hypothetical protein